MEKQYKALSFIDHVILRYSMYMGSVDTEKRDEWVFDEVQGKMLKKENVLYNAGLLKILYEVVDNVIDNSKIENNPTTILKFNMTEDTITVKNNGKSIPIRKEDIGTGRELYIPTVIFGVPHTGSNFNEDREDTIGMNGLGVKLTNIMSTEFAVTCFDDGKKFTQKWSNHMKEVSKESVKEIKKKPAMTTIVEFKPDMKFFNIESLLDFQELIYSRLMSISAIESNLKIFFNDKLVKCNDFKSYVKLFTGDSKIYHDKSALDFEYCIGVSRTGTFEHQSFVNTQRTLSDKSTEVKMITKKIGGIISEYLKEKNKSSPIRLNSALFMNYLFIFVNMRMKNPQFSTQSKDELISNVDKIAGKLDGKKIIATLKKNGVIQELENELQSKVWNTTQSALNTTVKRQQINIPKLDDAHDAGTKRSSDTMLFLVEGDSAKTMVTTGMSIIGHKKYGVFPLKGKVLNVIGATPKKLSGNAEISNIMKILGLNFGKKYETEEERATLRYGMVCLLCDADTDGYHITGLLITFFQHFWPALLRSNFIKRFVTPIVKASKGPKQIKYFFTMDSFNSDSTVNTQWNVKHLKGLGTSTREETLKYFKHIQESHLKHMSVDEETEGLVKHIFDPADSTWRKNWLTTPNNEQRLDYSESLMNISSFLKTEMHDYSTYNIKRAIPSVIDGFKVSQRKIIHACFNKFGSNNSTTFKVAQLASHAAAITNYAHGEESLQKTIVGMAQSYSGSNNLPLLSEDGAFGTRMENGGDSASARYIYTNFRSYATTLINETSPDVLTYLVEENTSVEPEFYVPTLPLVLINGANGIGTGFRSLVPCFNPDVIRQNIVNKLQGREIIPLIPWYGGTYKTNNKTRLENKQYVFEGNIKSTGTQIIIDELPIGVSICQYKDDVLTKLVESGKINKFITDHTSENEPKFIVYGYAGKKDDQAELINVFKLRNTISANCMYLLDQHGLVCKFDSPEAIFEYWFDIRSEYIRKSFNHNVTVMEEEIKLVSMKLKFIKLVTEKVLELRNIERDIVVQRLNDEFEISPEYSDKFLQMSLISITKERYVKLANDLHELEVKLAQFKTRTFSEIFLEETEIVNKKRKHN